MPKFKPEGDIAKGTHFPSLLAEIEAAQPEYPGMWGEVIRYDSPATAANRANLLRKDYGDRFKFRSAKDPDTEEGVVWAQYIGGEGDRDILDSQD